MSRHFQGSAILPGRVEGEALVTHSGFNTLAAIGRSLIFKSKKAVCLDKNNKELYKKVLTGKILCLPQTVGSTTGGLVLETAFQREIGPIALLFSEQIDSLSASGVILSDVWLKKRVVTIDRLGNEFLKYTKSGQWIKVRENGKVTVG